MLPFIAIHFGINLVRDEKSQGQGERSIGDDFSQAMTHTAILIPLDYDCQAKLSPETQLNGVAARGSWTKEENRISGQIS